MNLEIAYAERVRRLTGSVARDILSRAQDRQIVSLAGGLPDPALWEGIELPSVSRECFQYGPSEGERALRELLADGLALRGVAASAANVLVTTGSQQGLDLAAKLLISPGAPVAVEAPTYLAALQVFELFEARPLPIPRGADGLDLGALASILATERPRLVYLNPTFQNPSGGCLDEAQRADIAALLDASGAVLLEDDPYRDLYYEAEPPPPICSMLTRAPWIHLSSTSKTLMPGLRVGCLACSPELYPNFVKLKQAADLHSDRLAQSIATSLLRDAAAQAARLARARALYRQKRDAMAAALASSFGARAHWEIPRGGMFFWLRLAERADLAAALELALAAGVAFMPGDPFFPPAAREPGRHVRLNFTRPSVEEIARAVPKVAAALERAGIGID